MKIVKLMGGLGNQMFQYVFGLALAQITSEVVLYDKFWFDEIKKHRGQVTKRVYGLNVFNADISFATKKQIKKCINEKVEVEVEGFNLLEFLRKFLNQSRKITNNIITENPINCYSPKLFEIQGDSYYEGYFQTEKYFNHIREDILEAFSLKIALDEKNLNILSKIKSTNSVSLHIRRGDYVTLNCVLADSNYYEKAIVHIAQNVETPHFFLFSDDILWVKDNLKIDYPYTIVDINDDETNYFDLELMKNCKHNITANSSFSWWGAWLNKNPEKIVIAPMPWSEGETGHICDKWIRLQRQ